MLRSFLILFFYINITAVATEMIATRYGELKMRRKKVSKKAACYVIS